MKRTILIIGALLTSISVFSQQDAQYTNYMYNPLSVNPAYAGSRGTLSVFGLHRRQWVDLEGAPNTTNLSIQTPLNNSIGLGVSFVNDNIGPASENILSLDLSYAVPASDAYTLSFGLKGTANMLNVDYSNMNIYNPEDPLAMNNIDNEFSPNVGAGFYLYSDKTYVGVSVSNLLETDHLEKELSELSYSSVATERLHYYFMAGHIFDMGPSLKFKPAVLTKFVYGSPLQIDASANFMIKDKLTLGLAYRWDAAFSALAGFQVSKSLMIGYGYDMEVTNLNNYNYGSHEVFLRYELFNNYEKVVQPRFF